ncbi:putative deacetylvindoline O-acetyltransferase-like [Capsicum annuum]|uniref:acylsugar acyltransferase 3 n=1 Tax=Capsicum annuum TaxID=4072 RepID=UPI0007BFB85C|nr:acylsugar acyltransferase 3 [Capsicum annuum]KAF3635005.1 putative deacetylvindoline O-acetyltransferase-like [Capsicum annuum]KAF3681577.1 putative deacetylvindoline O-acetyltransferase-like [Capsicum annuum]
MKMAASTIVSRKIIKPFTPTPPSLVHHNLSLVDYINTPEYCPIVFFYSKPENCDINQISHILENSLSKVLSFYYLFAGLIKDDNSYVDCNDMGVEYLHVRISCPMSEILNHPYNDVVDVVFPHDLPWSSSLNRSPLVVQLSHFDCGGIAVSACLSHKVVDGYSLSRFLNDWADIARQVDFKPSPQFNASSFIPLMDDAPAIPNGVPEPQRHVSRMYNFSSSSLRKLKDIVATDSGVVQNPTRVEVATALLLRCGVVASMEKSGAFKPILWSHVMNMRPPIPLDTIGNAISCFGSVAMTEDDIKLPNLFARLREAKQQLRGELKDKNTDQLAAHVLKERKEGADIKMDMFGAYYSCTSICNLGFCTIDFGWGRPVRVTLARNSRKNNFLFLDDPSGDGINVIVTLTEDDMLMFQNNKELLEFASPVVQ